MFPIIWNQIKTKTNPHTVLRHSLTTILDAKLSRFHCGFFELEMLEIFTRVFFFIKTHYYNLKLSIVTLSSVLLKNGNRIPKKMRATWKILHITRDITKSLKRRKNEKRKVKDKFNSVTTYNRIIYFYFLYMENNIFAQKHNLGKCSLWENLLLKS